MHIDLPLDAKYQHHRAERRDDRGNGGESGRVWHVGAVIAEQVRWRKQARQCGPWRLSPSARTKSRSRCRVRRGWRIETSASRAPVNATWDEEQRRFPRASSCRTLPAWDTRGHAAGTSDGCASTNVPRPRATARRTTGAMRPRCRSCATPIAAAGGDGAALAEDVREFLFELAVLASQALVLLQQHQVALAQRRVA